MIDRIKLIIKAKNLSASKFADLVGVQRSSVSHVLSGRNKPSLEFVQKILTEFADIRSDWLLFGKGSMSNSTDLFSDLDDKSEEKNIDINDNTDKEKSISEVNKGNLGITNAVVKIVLFYQDSTFKEFSPKE